MVSALRARGECAGGDGAADDGGGAAGAGWWRRSQCQWTMDGGAVGTLGSRLAAVSITIRPRLGGTGAGWYARTEAPSSFVISGVLAKHAFAKSFAHIPALLPVLTPVTWANARRARLKLK